MKPEKIYLQLQTAIEKAKTIPPCQVTDPEVWFGNEGDPLSNRFKVAQKMCAPCPVKQLCAEFALANNELYGVWGGLSPNERKALKASRQRGQGRSRLGRPSRSPHLA